MKYFAVFALLFIAAAPHAVRADDTSAAAPAVEARPQEVQPSTDTTPPSDEPPQQQSSSQPIDPGGNEVQGDHVTQEPKGPVDVSAQKDSDGK
jgi:hypothetical protein